MTLKAASKRILLLMGLLSVAATVVAGTRMENEKWPSYDCRQCSFIWFDGLQMKMPVSWLRRVSVMNAGGIALGLSKSEKEDGNTMLFISLPGRHFSGPFRSKGWLKRYSVPDEEAYFDLLGNPKQKGRNLALMRKVMRMDKRLVRFTKAKKGRLTVYFFRYKNVRDNEMVILVDGGKRLYLVGGPVSRDFYRALLANLSVFGKGR